MPVFYEEDGIQYAIHLEAIGNQKHSKPHVHAIHGKHKISIDFEGNIIAGKLPKQSEERKARKFVKTHLDMCKAEWDKYCGGEQS